MRILNYFFILTLGLVISSCSASKKAEKNIESGNYDQAFEIGYRELSKDKNDNDLVKAFKNAYDKANERDLKQIELYRTQNNPVNLKKIYALYEKLDARQYQVIALQPLYYNGKEVFFNVEDYSQEIASAKRDYSEYLYLTAQEKMQGNKLDAREAYKLYTELQYVNPAYVSNISDLIEDARWKGSNLVLMKLDNKIYNATSPEDIDELLSIGEGKMNNPWVIYHAKKIKNVTYDYEININLDHLNITPQQVNSEIVPQQARIVDGWEYVYDNRGNVAKDSLGNDIKRDKIILVQAEVRIFQQLKSSQLEGSVSIKNLRNNTLSNAIPILGSAGFENTYALFRGDQRAVDPKYDQLLKNQEVPFPSDIELIKYSLSDFKLKMLDYLNRQQF